MSKRGTLIIICAALALVWMSASGGLAGDYPRGETKATKASPIDDCVAHKAVKDCMQAFEKAGATTSMVMLEWGTESITYSDDPKTVRKIHEAVDTRDAIFNGTLAPKDLCQECQVFMGYMKEGKLRWESVKFDNGALIITTSTDPEIVKHMQEKHQEKHQEKKG